MEHGFEFVSAKPRKAGQAEDQPHQQSMRGDRKITKNPSTDQKKVRREMVRKQAGLPWCDECASHHEQSGHCQTCGSPYHTEHAQRADEDLADDVDSAFRGGHSRPEDLERMLVNNPTGPSKYSALTDTEVQTGISDWLSRSRQAALDDQSASECRHCGGSVRLRGGEGATTREGSCDDCGKSVEIQQKAARSEMNFLSAIAKRAKHVLDIPEGEL